MNPSQVAQTLRKIAGAIDNSQRPDKRLVIADLRTIIAEMQQGQQQEQQQQGQQQQQALPKSQGGKSMLKKLLDDAEKALESGDDSGFKGALEKLQKSAV